MRALIKPQIMGILNVTPDSFSDGGCYTRLDAALNQVEQMINDGATIIDVGGESTRPHAPVVTTEQELARVLPIVQAIKQQFDVAVSIDTSNPQVMVQAASLGADIWNDVRALTRPNALEVAALLNKPVVLMHMRGEPDTMTSLNQYNHILEDVKNELLQRITAAKQAGIKDEHIILDMGYGFAKNTAQNLYLLKHLDYFKSLGYLLLVGVSRKRMIGDVLNLSDPLDRVTGSVTAALWAVQHGAAIVRVHDVKQTAQAIAMWQAISQAQG